MRSASPRDTSPCHRSRPSRPKASDSAQAGLLPVVNETRPLPPELQASRWIVGSPSVSPSRRSTFRRWRAKPLGSQRRCCAVCGGSVPGPCRISSSWRNSEASASTGYPKSQRQSMRIRRGMRAFPTSSSHGGKRRNGRDSTSPMRSDTSCCTDIAAPVPVPKKSGRRTHSLRNSSCLRRASSSICRPIPRSMRFCESSALSPYRPWL